MAQSNRVPANSNFPSWTKNSNRPTRSRPKSDGFGHTSSTHPQRELGLAKNLNRLALAFPPKSRSRRDRNATLQCSARKELAETRTPGIGCAELFGARSLRAQRSLPHQQEFFPDPEYICHTHLISAKFEFISSSETICDQSPSHNSQKALPRHVLRGLHS